ncbi:MAG: nucleotide exchange factor GrpE [Bacteroidales bacterium]|nr:nucleotide exchange factor GrpE [Bacteroidales bacterium]
MNHKEKEQKDISEKHKTSKTTDKKHTQAKKSSKTTHAKKEDKKDDSLEKLAELQDKYLRLSAEFDNFRKRTLKEKMELTKSAGEDILLSLLPVMDDFERGMQALDKANDINAVKEGMHIIHKKFKDFLSQKGVKEIEAVSKDFDVDFHEAITKIPAPSDDLKGKVVDVIEKGYCLNEKVIRYSKVVVGE